MNDSYSFALSDTERLELASIGTREPTPAPTHPPFDYAPLRDRIKMHSPRAHTSLDHDDGETSPELAILGEDEQDWTERTYAPHILPSGRNRVAIASELKSMGLAWGE